MTKILHQVWIQGEGELPIEYQKNRKLWRSKLPTDWKMGLWDEESAKNQFPELVDLFPKCENHAMRADLILSRALFRFGGMITGTDSFPLNVDRLINVCENEDTAWVVLEDNPSGHIQLSCGLAYSAKPGHPFFEKVSTVQSRRVGEFKNVLKATGPQCWSDCFCAGTYDLTAHSLPRAYCRRWDDGGDVYRKEAFIDPGYAASWMKQAKTVS